MKHLDNEKGFTLVELLIALAILAVGLLGLAGMQVNAITANKFANRQSAMIAIAQGVMEDFMARPASSVTTAVSNATYDLDTATSATTLTLAGVGTVSATYTIVTNTPTTNVSRITVTVTAGSRTMTLTSYKRAV